MQVKLTLPPNTGAPAPPSPVIVPGTAAIDPMDTAQSPAESETSRAGDLPSTAPLYERAFGKDPTEFDDPTIYDIRPLHPDMTDAEKQAVMNVSHWPESDLHDLTAGDPPDMDLSNAKPANQTNFSTFQTYVEPYIRPFTEEDVAFLKERGDRVGPYLIPNRGTRGYKEVWAMEDGMDGIAPPRKQESDPNEARGSMEEMNDDTAETDEVSMGPVMNRLLSIIRPAPNGATKKDANTAEEVDGDVSMLNGIDGPIESQDQNGTQASAGAGAEDQQLQKPTTYLPPDAPRPTNIPTGIDYETLESRAIQELRHIGFLSPDDVPDYALHNDDEVAARLRTLQHELKRISRVNNIRKSRVLELTEERMAMQEYANIADDLDGQVNAAYLKRNRSLAKPNSKKGSASQASQHGRAGSVAQGQQQKGVGVVNGSAGGRGVSDGVRALMQKRRDWIEMVGPVVGFGRPPIPGDGETVFDEGSLRRAERGEVEVEAGDLEGEGE